MFAHARRLGHRLGLASWAGRRSADGERFDRLVVALDALDAADAFVHPDLMGAVARDGQGGRAARPWPTRPSRSARRSTSTIATGARARRPVRPDRRPLGRGAGRRRAASASPGTSCCCTSRRCRTCSPGSAGRSSSCWPGRTWWSGCGPATARWPRRARSSRSGCTSGRSCCASVLQPVEVDDGVHRLAVEPGVTDRDAAAADQPDRRRPASTGGTSALGGPPPPGRGRPPGARARHRVRPRQAHLPGPAVLAGRDHPRGDPPPRPLRPRRRLRRPAAGAGPDRRRGPLGRPVPGPLLARADRAADELPAARRSRAGARTRPVEDRHAELLGLGELRRARALADHDRGRLLRHAARAPCRPGP